MPGGNTIIIRWTTHGRTRAMQRGISASTIRGVVSDPTVRRDQDGGRIRVEKLVRARWVLVVYRPIAGNQVLVVTAFVKGE